MNDDRLNQVEGVASTALDKATALEDELQFFKRDSERRWQRIEGSIERTLANFELLQQSQAHTDGPHRRCFARFHYGIAKS